MIYILLVGIVLTYATLFSIQFVTTRAKAAALNEATHNARFALARLSTEVREAQGINTGSSVFGTHPGTLSLATSDSLNDPTVFTVSGGALMVQQGAGSALPLTSSAVEVTNFVVEDISTPGRTRVVRATLTVMFRNPDGLQTFDAEVTVTTTVPVFRADGFSSFLRAPPAPLARMFTIGHRGGLRQRMQGFGI